MNQQQTKFSMKSGLLIGSILIVFNLITYFAGQYGQSWTGAVLFIFFFAGLVLTTINFREKQLNGNLTYGQALGTALLVSVFVGLLVGVYTFLFREFINPLDIEKEMTKGVQELYDKGMTEQQVEHTMKTTRLLNTPIFTGLMTFFSFILFGFVFTLISGLFLRKEKTK